MSDCSTNAWRVPERPRTCDTCAKAKVMHVPSQDCDSLGSVDSFFGGNDCPHHVARVETNYDHFAATPADVARLLQQFSGYYRGQRPAVVSYQRWLSEHHGELKDGMPLMQMWLESEYSA